MAQLAGFAHIRGTGRDGSSTVDELIAAVSRPKWQGKVLQIATLVGSQLLKDYEEFKAA